MTGSTITDTLLRPDGITPRSKKGLRPDPESWGCPMWLGETHWGQKPLPEKRLLAGVCSCYMEEGGFLHVSLLPHLSISVGPAALYGTQGPRQSWCFSFGGDS